MSDSLEQPNFSAEIPEDLQTFALQVNDQVRSLNDSWHGIGTVRGFKPDTDYPKNKIAIVLIELSSGEIVKASPMELDNQQYQ